MILHCLFGLSLTCCPCIVLIFALAVTSRAVLSKWQELTHPVNVHDILFSNQVCSRYVIVPVRDPSHAENIFCAQNCADKDTLVFPRDVWLVSCRNVTVKFGMNVKIENLIAFED